MRLWRWALTPTGSDFRLNKLLALVVVLLTLPVACNAALGAVPGLQSLVAPSSGSTPSPDSSVPSRKNVERISFDPQPLDEDAKQLIVLVRNGAPQPIDTANLILDVGNPGPEIRESTGTVSVATDASIPACYEVRLHADLDVDLATIRPDWSGRHVFAGTPWLMINLGGYSWQLVRSGEAIAQGTPEYAGPRVDDAESIGGLKVQSREKLDGC